MDGTAQPLPLNSFQQNVFSQGGEDGIIEEIVNRISQTSRLDGWCVEFGAWDGIHLSNTYNLIKNKNYKGVLIEGDVNKYKILCENIPRQDVIKICQFISFVGEFTLDRILAKTDIPNNFDFLSIDIDGCDYFVFESLNTYRPKIICIEFNPTIPNDVEFVQPRNFSIKQGSSAKSLTRLAETKGYNLVATTYYNLFFVQSNLKELVIGSEQVTLEKVRDDSKMKCYIFCGYDGTILTNKTNISMPWHGFQFDSGSLQQLPKFLRKYPGDYNSLQKIVLKLLLAVRFS